MLVVAVLTIRDVDAFDRFEHQAAEIMARYGGRIEHAYRIDGEPLRELHVVRFPNDSSFAEYRRDPEIVALAALREQAIAGTDIIVGRDPGD